MKTPKWTLFVVMTLQGILCSCGTAPDEEDAVIQLQYRIKSVYTNSSANPVQSAIARAHIYKNSKYRPKVAVTASFSMNDRILREAGEGSYILNDVAVLENPYVLNWTIAGYGDSTLEFADTIGAPMTLSQIASADTISKGAGTTIDYAGSSRTDDSDNKRVYCLIMLDNTGGERDYSDDSHSMFDQSDNGRIELTPVILEALKPNRRYVLSVERGTSKQVPHSRIRIVSSSFSELTTPFYLSE